MTQDEITALQRLVATERPTFLQRWARARRKGRVSLAIERRTLRRSARWWDLEAMRGYVGVVDEYGMNSSDRSKMYAANSRWVVELMDNGVRVIGVRFDRLVAFHARMTWDEFNRRHAEGICGERYIQKRKR